MPQQPYRPRSLSHVVGTKLQLSRVFIGDMARQYGRADVVCFVAFFLERINDIARHRSRVDEDTIQSWWDVIWGRRQRCTRRNKGRRGRVPDQIRSGQDGILPSLISFSSRDISCRLFAFRIISSTCFRSSSVSLIRCCVLPTGPADEESGWPFAVDDEPSEGMSKVRD